MVSRIVITPKRPAPPPADAGQIPAAPSPLPSPEEKRPSQRRPAPGSPITRRAILLGLLLIPPNVYWVGMTECIWHGLHFTCLSLAMNVVFFLLLLMVGNALVAHRWPRWMLSQAELLTIFGTLAISSELCGHDRITVLMGVIGLAGRFAEF